MDPNDVYLPPSTHTPFEKLKNMYLDETCPELLLSDVLNSLRDLQYLACASEVYMIMKRIRYERMGYTWAGRVEQEDEVDEDLDDQENEGGGLPKRSSYVF